MSGIGFSEILLVIIVALIVLGPKRLPEIAHTLGRWHRNLQSFLANIQAHVEKQTKLDELEKNTQRAKQADSTRNKDDHGN